MFSNDGYEQVSIFILKNLLGALEFELKMKQFMVLDLVIWIWAILFFGVGESERPESVKIGAVFTFDSVIGRVAKAAMEMAVSDVNSDSTVLNGTKLDLIMKDGMCNAFLGSTGGTKLQP